MLCIVTPALYLMHRYESGFIHLSLRKTVKELILVCTKRKYAYYAVLLVELEEFNGEDTTQKDREV